jgi:hypothetical protein
LPLSCARSRRACSARSAAVHAATGPKAKSEAFITTRLKLIRDVIGEVMGQQVGAELQELLPLAARARQEFLLEEANVLEQILKDGQRQGVFRRVPSASVTHLIIAAMRGIELHLPELPDARGSEDTVESMLALFFKGLCR